MILWWTIPSDRNESGIIIDDFCGKVRISLLELSTKERILTYLIFCISFY